MTAIASFAPYRPPMTEPQRDTTTAAALRTNRALAAVMWAIAIATLLAGRLYVS